jgi:lysophospholipase L1-like esterase
MENMCRIGQAGLACYVDGRFGRAAFPAAQEMESPLFQSRPRTPAAVTVYLPLYHPVELVAFGFDDDAAVVAPPPFAAERPVVFYGSSITQGGCASQPGNSYEAMLGRDLNVDFVNLGFSGNGIGESEVARLVASVDASCFVVDFGVNCPTVEAMRSAYGPFLAAIRAAHPEVPMVCVSPIFSTPEAWERDWHGKLDGMRRVAREAVEARVASGDRRVEFVDGLKLIGPDGGDGLVDGVHPNDLGFRMMADGLRPAVSKALGLGAATRARGRRPS